MERMREWIKTAIALCMNLSENETENRSEFENLEKSYQYFSEKERKGIVEIIKSELNPDDIVYVLSCFNFYTEIEDFRREIVGSILQREYGYYIGSMLDVQIRRNQLGSFTERRQLHRKNVDSLSELLWMQYNYVPQERRNHNRIVIITEQILGPLHSPTRIVMDFAHVLQEDLGYEVILFACPCDGALPPNLWYLPEGEKSFEQFKGLPIRLEYNEAIFKGYQINMGGATSLKEYGMMLDLIYAWNPFFVLGIGVDNAVADLPKQFTTVVNIGMTINCPVSEAQLLLRFERNTKELELEYTKALQKSQKQLFVQDRFPLLMKEAEKQYTREELGLPENDFLIAVVGNRLDIEIDREFASVVQQILENNSNTDFLFIGKVETANHFFQKEIFLDRVYYLGSCNDLAGVYSVVDLYMNPKRLGGGVSSAMALREGVPVVTLPDCDVSSITGEGFVVQSYEEMKQLAYRYIEDKEFYSKMCEKAKSKVYNEGEFPRFVKKVTEQIIQVITGEAGENDSI